MGKLKIGVDIPAPGEIRAILAALEGRWRPLLLTAIFTGLRASELRGLRWEDVDLKKRRAARPPARRPLQRHRPAQVGSRASAPCRCRRSWSNTLREWKLACPKGDLDLVFPNGTGGIEKPRQHRQARR